MRFSAHTMTMVMAAIVWWMVPGGASLAGHHSFDAEYDSNKPITISCVVTKLEW